MWFLLALACSEYDLERPVLGDGLAEDTAGGANPLFEASDDQVIDAFDVATQTDILVFGDTSTSMEPELLTMNAHIEGLVTRLATFQSDWHLLAVTGPSGCSANGWSDASTPDWAGRFAQDLLTPPGADDVDEWGLNNVLAAAQNSGDGGCNEGFLRPNSLLHVIFVSDEDDNSPGWENGGDYWKPYLDGLRALSNVKLSAVGGPVPEACDGAEPGHGYWEAVAASEGTFISICSDWDQQIEDLANTSAEQRSFTLTTLAVPGTVQVAVEGELRDRGWTYDGALNKVVFDNSAPIAGQHVEIAYEPRP